MFTNDWNEFYKINRGHEGNAKYMPKCENDSHGLFYNMLLCQNNFINDQTKKTRCIDKCIKIYNSDPKRYEDHENYIDTSKKFMIVKNDEIIYEKNLDKHSSKNWLDSYKRHGYEYCRRNIFDLTNKDAPKYHFKNPHISDYCDRIPHNNNMTTFAKDLRLKKVLQLYNEINKCTPEYTTCIDCRFEDILQNFGIEEKTIVSIDNELTFSTADINNDVLDAFKQCINNPGDDSTDCISDIFFDLTSEEHNIILINDNIINTKIFNTNGHDESYKCIANIV